MSFLCNFMVFFSLLLVVVSGELHANAPLVAKQQSWQGEFPVWLDKDARYIEREEFDIKGQIVRKRTILKWEEGRTALGWGTVWHLRPMGKSKGVYYTENTDQWIMAGMLRIDGMPKAFIPLAPDRILMLAGDNPFVLDGKASILAIAKKKEDGDFVLEKLIQPLSQTILEKVAQPGDGILENAPGLFRVNTSIKAFISQTFIFNDALFMPLPRGAAVISYYTGHIWILDEKGDIRRHVALFNKFSEDQFSRVFAFEGVLLGALPTKDGRILLASRSESAVFDARKKNPVVDYRSGKAVLTENSQENQMAAAFLYPAIQWWELNPETGGFSRLSPPPFGAPEELPPNRDEAQLWLTALDFHLTRDGSVVVDMGPLLKRALDRQEIVSH